MTARPFVIWAAARTSSTNLCLALGAENEPFQAGPPASRLAWAYDDWRVTGDVRPIIDLAKSRTSFKHIPEDFDDGFNQALAEWTTLNGYQHIHLVRLDEVSRLISLDVAGQLDAWWPHDAEARFAELRSGLRHLNPLDVPRLVGVSKNSRRSWAAVACHLGPVLTVTFERLTAREPLIRRPELSRLRRFLELREEFERLDAAMGTGGQDTGQIRDLIPNIDELRRSLA
jgi:hypothetical protein